MKYIKYWGVCCCFLFVFSMSNAQDCTLNIGGKDKDVIVRIFQLNEKQLEKMQAWRGELELKTKLIEDQVQLLLDKHPQSTKEDLTDLAEKYKAKEQEMVGLSLEYDKKLLRILNERQYQRYVDLCKAALRTPLRVESIGVPE